MITTSNSPVKGSGIPNHYVGDLLHTLAISGLSRVRTELLHVGIVPASPPHPVQLDRQFPCHRYFRDLPPAPQGEVKELAAPLRLAAYGDLGRLHQQKTQQSVALLADVAESSPIPAGLFRRNQPNVAGDLLCALETVWGSDDEFKRQGGQWTDTGMRP